METGPAKVDNEESIPVGREGQTCLAYSPSS